MQYPGFHNLAQGGVTREMRDCAERGIVWASRGSRGGASEGAGMDEMMKKTGIRGTVKQK